MAITDPDAAWVSERLAALDAPVDWQPDARAALSRRAARLQGRARRSPWIWRTAAAACLVSGLAVVPTVRLAAQRAWDVLFAGQVTVLRVDLDDLPAAVKEALQEPSFTGRIEASSVAGRDEASRRAGFAVRMPRADLLTGTPDISVVSPMSGALVLRVAALERAAATTGLTGIAVPAAWEGARISVETGPLVISTYGETTLLQTTPVAIAVPAGFDFPAFVELALRLSGFSAAEASALAAKAAISPMAFLGIPRGERVTVTEMPLRTGTATMIHELDPHGQVGKLTLIWSRTDRIYLLSGPIADYAAIAIAESLNP